MAAVHTSTPDTRPQSPKCAGDETPLRSFCGAKARPSGGGDRGGSRTRVAGNQPHSNTEIPQLTAPTSVRLFSPHILDEIYARRTGQSINLEHNLDALARLLCYGSYSMSPVVPVLFVSTFSPFFLSTLSLSLWLELRFYCNFFVSFVFLLCRDRSPSIHSGHRCHALYRQSSIQGTRKGQPIERRERLEDGLGSGVLSR